MPKNSTNNLFDFSNPERYRNLELAFFVISSKKDYNEFKKEAKDLMDNFSAEVDRHLANTRENPDEKAG